MKKNTIIAGLSIVLFGCAEMTTVLNEVNDSMNTASGPAPLTNIEVIKGASSLLYGSSAIGGIVHIQTALPSDTPLTRLHVYSGVYSDPARETLKWNKKPLYQPM